MIHLFWPNYCIVNTSSCLFFLSHIYHCQELLQSCFCLMCSLVLNMALYDCIVFNFFSKIFYSDITFIYVFSLPGVGTFCGTLVFIIELVIVATTSSIPESVTASEGFVVVPLHDVSTAGSQLWLLPTTVCKWKAEIKVTQIFWLLFHLFITVWSSSVWKSIDCSLMINLQNILISIWSIREEEPF